MLTLVHPAPDDCSATSTPVSAPPTLPPTQTERPHLSPDGPALRLTHRRHTPARHLLPWPTGATALTVESDGSLIYDSGACYGVVSVDLINLESLAPDDQSTVCAAFNRLATSLAPGQHLQLLLESQPLQPAAVQEMVASFVTTTHPALATLARAGREDLRQQMARTFVPDRRGYLLIGPAPETTLGVAGMMQSLGEAVGLRRPGHAEPDRYGLDAAVGDVLAVCKEMRLRAERLRGGAVRSLLWRCARPDEEEPPGLHTTPDLAALLAPPTWEEQFSLLQIGSTSTRSLYLLEPADLTSPGWLDDLVSLDSTLRLSWHLVGRDREAERTRQLRRRRGFLTAAQARRLGDPDTADAAGEAERLMADLLDPSVGIVQSTLILTLQAPTRAALEAATRRARRILRTRLAVPFGLGRGHQRRLWQSSLPLGVDCARRSRRWHSYSVANGLPFLTHSPGMARGFPLGYTTQGGELAPLNLSDPSLPTWAVTINGRQGSGKTFLTQLLALHTLYEGGRVTVIDRAGHYRTLIDLAEGVYIGLGKAEEPPTLNLWELKGGESLKSKVQMVHAAHEIMLCHPGEKLDKRLDAALERAIRRVYDAYFTSLAEGTRPAHAAPLERDLQAQLQAMSEEENLTEAERDAYRLLRDSLHSYVGEGRYAHLVDRPTTVDLETRLLCWDFEGVDESQHPLLMFIIGYAMTQRAQNTYDQRGERHPELLAVDEGFASYDALLQTLETKGETRRNISRVNALTGCRKAYGTIACATRNGAGKRCMARVA